MKCEGTLDDVFNAINSKDAGKFLCCGGDCIRIDDISTIQTVRELVQHHMQFKDAPQMRKSTLRQILLRDTFPLASFTSSMVNGAPSGEAIAALR